MFVLMFLVPLLLASCGTFSLNKLGVENLFSEARVRHADNMTSPSELMLGNGGLEEMSASTKRLLLVRQSSQLILRILLR